MPSDHAGLAPRFLLHHSWPIALHYDSLICMRTCEKRAGPGGGVSQYYFGRIPCIHPHQFLSCGSTVDYGMLKKSVYYAQEMCLLWSRNVPLCSRNVPIILKKCAHYTVGSRNFPTMLKKHSHHAKKCSYYVQEMGLLCSRNAPIVFKKCV